MHVGLMGIDKINKTFGICIVLVGELIQELVFNFELLRALILFFDMSHSYRVMVTVYVTVGPMFD